MDLEIIVIKPKLIKLRARSEADIGRYMLISKQNYFWLPDQRMVTNGIIYIANYFEQDLSSTICYIPLGNFILVNIVLCKLADWEFVSKDLYLC